jgi:hypothetical protein
MNHAELIYGADAYATFGIDFGRYLYDPQLAFDPRKFNNPQLKITHNRLLIGATTSTHLLEVFAHCFDEKAISPIGFLMAKEHHIWTPSANDAYEYVDLPTDYPIRQLLLRNYKSGQDPHDVADYFRLSEDNDKRIPIDCELEAYIRRMKGEWLPVEEGCVEYASDAIDYNKYVTPTDHMTAYVGMGLGVAGEIELVDYIKGGFVQRTHATGSVMVVGFVKGYLPHHCIQFPFGIQSDLDDWYDVTRLGSLKARIQSAAQYSGAEISIILEQLRRY